MPGTKTIYLDHAATTPMCTVAIEAWQRHARDLNPGGQYSAGRKARAALESARERIAELLGADPIEVVFTASGTESDNLAVAGLYRASESNRIITSTVEHSAVEQVASSLVEQGAQRAELPVDRWGHVSDFAALNEPAAVAACMLANNETGAIQPVEEIVARASATHTPVHIDAVQAVGRIPVNFHHIGCTTLAASAHKFGGPRGMGILLAKRSPAPRPLLVGGGQERGLRPGTADVASACAMASALAESVQNMEQECQRIGTLRTQLREGICAKIPRARINTAEPALPGHLNVSFADTDGDSLIMLLDAAGIAASTGSACSNGVNRASRVLLAAGYSEEEAAGTLRFSIGRTNTAVEIDQVLEVLPDIVERARLAHG